MTIPQKEIALAFQKLVVSGNIREAFEKYVHPNFFHHNPYSKGDRESLLKAMEESDGKFSNISFDPSLF